jgi:hypothetical protein
VQGDGILRLRQPPGHKCRLPAARIGQKERPSCGRSAPNFRPSSSICSG